MLRERRRAANNKPNRRLDRKSSRGMIYENEELRLRTININAEVERGQSDIRKLRRENEHLRREIWALRDEYDRLDKLLSGANLNNNNSNLNNNNNNNNNNNSSRPPSGGSSGSSTASGSSDGSASSDGESEINNSCDENENGEKLNETTDCETLDNNKNLQKSTIVNHNGHNGNELHHSAPHYSSLLKNRENLHVNFDHLSIVSEETLTSTPNSPTSPKPEFLNELLGARQLSPIDPISTLTPLNELQSVQPPLYHFENLSYETLGPSIDSNGQILKPPQLITPSKLGLSLSLKTKPVFFGPMRPSRSIENLKKSDQPLYATVKKSQKLTLPTASGAAIAFQNGGNLEDLLKEITLNPFEDDDNIIDDTMQPDIVAIEGDKLESKPVSPTNPRKHRSQINLVLNYNGTKPGEKSNSDTSPASTSASPSTVESPLENRLNKIGFEKFIPTSRPEHIYSTVDTPPPKVTPPQFNGGGINCNGNSPKTPDKPFEKLPPVIDVKRKTRRVSLCFNGRKTVDAKKGRRASIDVVSIEKNLADFSNSTTPFQRRHSTNLHQNHNNHHHTRKSSHESIKILQSLQLMTKTNGTAEVNAATPAETNGRRSLSRESTSSIITQKSRKVSTSSQSTRIPWCACWGNGCF